jgi:hypothetical protein
MSKNIKICFGPHRIENFRASIELGSELKSKKEIEEFTLKPFSSLREMAEYVRLEKSASILGVVPFYDDVREIIPVGLDLLKDSNLFISRAVRLFFKGNTGRRIPTRKDFLAVSSFQKSKMSPEKGKSYATLAIVSNAKKSDEKKINGIILDQKLISFESKYEARRQSFYFKINHHFSQVKTEPFNVFSFRILGGYEVPE